MSARRPGCRVALACLARLALTPRPRSLRSSPREDPSPPPRGAGGRWRSERSGPAEPQSSPAAPRYVPRAAAAGPPVCVCGGSRLPRGRHRVCELVLSRYSPVLETVAPSAAKRCVCSSRVCYGHVWSGLSIF